MRLKTLTGAKHPPAEKAPNREQTLGRDKAQALSARAAQAARLLKLLANERRLLILCRLVETGEMNVTQLAEAAGLAQSALSQHLAKMREDGLVAFRRESQTIWYRIADPSAQRVLEALHDIFVVAGEDASRR
jgi:DNA-binding transcriptional ArsR family regulator